MWKISLISIGKTVAEYQPLMSHWLKMVKWHVVEHAIPAPNVSSKTKEAELLRKHIKPGLVIALDPRGKQMTSEQFAELLQASREQARDVYFVFGGSQGLCESIVSEVDKVLSLSDMTMPHLLAKAMLVEQIYRAQTIVDRHPYHK